MNDAERHEEWSARQDEYWRAYWNACGDCPTCGVKAGEPCRNLNNHAFMRPTIRKAHKGRPRAVGSDTPHMSTAPELSDATSAASVSSGPKESPTTAGSTTPGLTRIVMESHGVILHLDGTGLDLSLALSAFGEMVGLRATQTKASTEGGAVGFVTEPADETLHDQLPGGWVH